MKALLFGLILSATAHADEMTTVQTKTLTGYDCAVRVFAKDLPSGMQEATFERPLQGGTHGGEAAHFEFGRHVVEVLVDSKWRNVTWWIGGKLTAATVSAKSDIVTGYDTVILYNPANTDEEVDVACSPKYSMTAIN